MYIGYKNLPLARDRNTGCSVVKIVIRISSSYAAGILQHRVEIIGSHEVSWYGDLVVLSLSY